MPEHPREIPDRYVDVWKYTTAIAVALLIGFVGGQYVPNRSIVTDTELATQLSPLKEQIGECAHNTAEQNAKLSNLAGRLEGAGVIPKSP